MSTQSKKTITLKESVLFALLGTIMFCTKVMMEMLPNIHLLGMFIMVFTLTFRKKALIPIYIYVFLDGLFGGFSLWWVPYLYIWTVLWGITMLLPKKMPKAASCIVYPVVCGLHGVLFGILYAPAQMIIMRLNFEMTVAWVIAGFPFDLIHGLGNLAAGCLVYPLSVLMKKLYGKMIRQNNR